MAPPKSTTPTGLSDVHTAYLDARDELREAALMLRALSDADPSQDLTKPAWRRAREAMTIAAKSYAAAHDAHFGGGTPEERRRAARVAVSS